MIKESRNISYWVFSLTHGSSFSRNIPQIVCCIWFVQNNATYKILMKIHDNSTKQQIDYFEVITEKSNKNCPKMNKLDMKQIQSHSFIKFKSKKMFWNQIFMWILNFYDIVLWYDKNIKLFFKKNHIFWWCQLHSHKRILK